MVLVDYFENQSYMDSGKNPFILYSKPPVANFREFIMSEVRYSQLVRSFPDKAEKLFEMAEKNAKDRYVAYEKMAK